ncbi:MAG: Na+/H+ antiporter subunit C [Acetobacteraceae bacterium]
MEPLLALLFGVLLGASVYLMLSKSLIRVILGLIVLGNAANLSIFTGGRIFGISPPLVPDGATALLDGAANPLPQALVLTAIVISFGLTAFVLVLAWAASGQLRTLDTSEMRFAEPPGLPAPTPEEAAAAEQAPLPAPAAPDAPRAGERAAA